MPDDVVVVVAGGFCFGRSSIQGGGGGVCVVGGDGREDEGGRGGTLGVLQSKAGLARAVIDPLTIVIIWSQLDGLLDIPRAKLYGITNESHS